MATNNGINLAEISEQLKKAASLSEVQEIVENNGFDWAEVNSKFLSDEELSEGELETVSGGGILGSLGSIFEAILKYIIDRRTVETTTCTYSKDGNTRTCTTTTTYKK